MNNVSDLLLSFDSTKIRAKKVNATTLTTFNKSLTNAKNVSRGTSKKAPAQLTCTDARDINQKPNIMKSSKAHRRA